MNNTQELNKIFESNKDKRICVIGTSCIGKSTLLKELRNCYDMDDLLFPLLSKEETEYVCRQPWTNSIGSFMNKVTRERIKINVGNPVFGTVLIECDLIVLLTIDKELLESRCMSRNADFNSSWKMQNEIIKEVKSSNIPYIKLKIK